MTRALFAGQLAAVVLLALSSSCYSPHTSGVDEGDPPRKQTVMEVPQELLPTEYRPKTFVPAKVMTLTMKVPVGADARRGDEYTVYITDDLGKTWRQIQPVAQNGDKMTIEVDEPGIYGLWADRHRKGEIPRRPQAGQSPHHVVAVDVEGPRIEFLTAGKGDVLGPLAREIRYRIDDMFLEPGTISIEYRPVGTEAWRPVASGLTDAGVHRWELPGHDGRVEFRVSASDRAGNKGSAVSPRPVLIDRGAPTVEAGGSLESRSSQVSLDYQAHDPEGTPVAEVRAYYRNQGFAGWTEGASFAPGQPVSIRLQDGAWEVFLVAADAVGNVSTTPAPDSRAFATVHVLTEPEAVVVDAQPTPDGRVAVAWRTETREAGGSLERVELFLRPAGAPDWQAAAEAGREATGTVDLALAPGTWEFAARAVFAGGRSEAVPGPSTAAEYLYVFEPAMPETRLLTFMEGGVFQGGTGASIDWEIVGPAPREIRIQFAGGSDASFDDLSAPLPGDARTFRWTLPMVTVSGCRVRVETADSHGRTASFESAPFAIDSSPPRVERVTGPEFVGPVEDFKIRLAAAIADEGEAGVAAVDLWSRSSDAPEWSPLRQDLPVRDGFDGTFAAAFRLDRQGSYDFLVTAADRVGNRTPPPDGRTPPMLRVVVDATAPVVRLDTGGQVFRAGDTLAVAWEAVDDHLSETPVRLEWSTAGREDWQAIELGLPATGSRDWTVPESAGAARIALRAVAVDRAGNVGSSAGSVERSADPRVTATGPAQGPEGRLTMTYLAEVDPRARLEGIDAWLSTDGGGNWDGPIAARILAPGTAEVDAPADGRYGIVLTGRDSLRGAERAPGPGDAPEIEALVDTEAPVLEAEIAPSDRRMFGAGEVLAVRWRATDANLGPDAVTVRRSVDGGTTWEDDSRQPPEGRVRWQIPEGTIEDDVVFQIVATDAAGRRTEVRLPSEGYFLVDATQPRLELRGARAMPDGMVEVAYGLSGWSGLRRLKGVELWLRREEDADWVRVDRLAREPEGTFRLEMRPGVHHFYGRILADGVDEPEPGPGTPPHLTFDFSPEASGLRLVTFVDGGTYLGGEEQVIRWEVDGESRGSRFRLYFSDSDGEAWGPIAFQGSGGSEIAGRTSQRWRLPRVSSPRCRIKVEMTDPWGRRAEDQSPVPFAIDSGVPRVVRVEGPAYLGAADDYQVRFTAELAKEGEAALASLDLWYRAGTTGEWMAYKTGIAIARSVFKPSFRLAQEGTHQFHLVVADVLGNRMPDPTPDSPPHYQVTIDVTSPVVELQVDSGRILRGGEPLDFAWRVTDENATPQGTRLEFSTDRGSTWKELAGGLALEGKRAFTIPRSLDGRETVFRAVHHDRAGNLGASKDDDMPIQVGVTELSVRAEGRTLSAAREVRVPLRATLDRRAQLSSVALWYSTNGGIGWKGPVEVALGEGEVDWAAPGDGDFGVILVGTDSVGGTEAPPARGDLPEGTVLVDTQPPTVRLLGFDRGDVYHNQPTYEIRWEPAADENLAADGAIRLEYETGDGAWQPVAERVENTGRFAWHMPAGLGGTIRFRITARDEVGNLTPSTGSGGLIVETTRPEIAITEPAAGSLVNKRLVDVSFQMPTRGRLPLEKVTLWQTFDGGARWQQAPGTYHARRTIREADGGYVIQYEGEEGVNGIWLVAFDQAGNHNADPEAGDRPQHEFEIDTTAPEVQIVGDPAGRIFSPGSSVEVAWRTREKNPADSPLEIRLSDSSGRDWSRAGVEDLPDRGAYEFELPKEDGLHYRLRVSVADAAGNVGTAETGAFMVDGTAPSSVAVGPADWGKSNRVPIRFQARDNKGGTGVAQIELWSTPLDGPRQWSKSGEGAWREDLTIPFQSTDGHFGLVSIAIDRAGNRETKQGFDLEGGGIPGPDTVPDFDVVVHAEGPLVRLVGPLDRGAVITGGDQPIEWETNWEPRPYQVPVVRIDLFLSRDSGRTWEPIAQGIANDPPYSWQVPAGQDEDRCRVRVRAYDKFGSTGEATSRMDFKIDVNAPRARIRFGDEVKPWISPQYFQETGEDPTAEAESALAAAAAAYLAGRYEVAEAEAARAAELAPKSTEAHYLRALVAEATGASDDRVSLLLNQAIALDPFHAKAQNDLGRLHFRTGAFDEAAGAFRRAIRGAEKKGEPAGDYHHNLGAALYRAKEYAAAADALKAALAARELPDTHYYLALTFLALDQPDAARPHLQEVVRLYPSGSPYGSWAKERLGSEED